MKNSKGQALVEFVIVVPILIFIIMAIIDIGNIVIKKMHLENNLNTVVSLYQDNDFDSIQSLKTRDNFNFVYNQNNEMTTIVLSQNIKIFTPFLNLIIGDNYTLETKRIIYEK